MSDDKPLLVFFTSERSGPARRMESLLAHLARKERTRLRIMRVDVEEQPDLAESSGSYVPTLVLVKGSASSTASTGAPARRGSRRCSPGISRPHA